MRAYIPSIIRVRTLTLFLLFSIIVSCRHKTADTARNNGTVIPTFKRLVIDTGSVRNPWAKISADVDGDGALDIIIGGQKGPLAWFRNPNWSGNYQPVELWLAEKVN